ncbi:MAG: HAMP domain-containing histidine kinase, partial [Anaerolineae bacterium]|nr:HAMP domain-containing histidine kinase [Anaerolineae bacterium]
KLTMIEDITGRKQAETELQRYRENLEELVRESTTELRAAHEELIRLTRLKDEFVGSVSHELRTPIANLKLYHYLLTSAPPDSHEKYMTILGREIDRLERLVDDVLYLSRLDRARIVPEPRPFDLVPLVDHLVADRVSLAEQRDLTLALTAAPDLPPVLADPRFIERVLSILLQNAMDYTPGGGHIEVWTCTQDHDGQQWIGLCVSNNGPSIPPDELPHIFERFYRGSAALDMGIPGTGLGLAIVKEIVERHQGRVEVESGGAAGEGTTFRVWLPVNAV